MNEQLLGAVKPCLMKCDGHQFVSVELTHVGDLCVLLSAAAPASVLANENSPRCCGHGPDRNSTPGAPCWAGFKENPVEMSAQNCWAACTGGCVCRSLWAGCMSGVCRARGKYSVTWTKLNCPKACTVPSG